MNAQHNIEAQLSDFLGFEDEPINCRFENWKEFRKDPERVQLQEKKHFKFKRARRSLEQKFIQENSDESKRLNRFYGGNAELDASKKVKKYLQKKVCEKDSQIKILHDQVKDSTAKLEKILEGKKNKEEQWNDEKHWLNQELFEKEKERKKCEQDTREANYMINVQDQQISQLNGKNDLLAEENQKLKVRIEEQRNDYEDQLEFYEKLKNQKNDLYWINKRIELAQEMEKRTKEIKQNNEKLKILNGDLIHQLSLKNEEINMLKKKIDEKNKQSMIKESQILELQTECSRLKSLNQRIENKLQQEDVRFAAAIDQRDQAFEHLRKLNGILSQLDKRQLDDLQLTTKEEAAEYIVTFKYQKDHPKNLAEKVEEAINKYNDSIQATMKAKLDLEQDRKTYQAKLKAAARKNAQMIIKNTNLQGLVDFQARKIGEKRFQCKQKQDFNEDLIKRAQSEDKFITILNPHYVSGSESLAAGSHDVISAQSPVNQDLDKI